MAFILIFEYSEFEYSDYFIESFFWKVQKYELKSSENGNR